MLGNIIGITLTIIALLIGAHITGTIGIALIILSSMVAFIVLVPMFGFTMFKAAIFIDYIHQVAKSWYVYFAVIFGALGLSLAGLMLIVDVGVGVAINLPDSAVDIMSKSPMDFIGTYENPGFRR